MSEGKTTRRIEEESDRRRSSPTMPLLGCDEVQPFEIVNPAGQSHIVIVCEHAGRLVPSKLGDLGLAAGEIDRHIGWDIGAAALARGLAAALDAPLVMQPYSRLVIDCNRPFEAPDCIPAVSDTTPVPANVGLGAAERRQRWNAIHAPFHAAVTALLDARRRAGQAAWLVAVHSFTPALRRDGVSRPWQIGLLHGRDARLAHALEAAFGEAESRALNLAINAPYVVDDLSDYTLPVHGERRGLPHVLIEVRQDTVGDQAGRQRWVERLARAIRAIPVLALEAA